MSYHVLPTAAFLLVLQCCEAVLYDYIGEACGEAMAFHDKRIILPDDDDVDVDSVLAALKTINEKMTSDDKATKAKAIADLAYKNDKLWTLLKKRNLESNVMNALLKIMVGTGANENAKTQAAKAIRYLAYDLKLSEDIASDKLKGTNKYTPLMDGIIRVMQTEAFPEAQMQATMAAYNLGEDAGGAYLDELLAPLQHLLQNGRRSGDNRNDVEGAAAGVFYTMLHEHPERVSAIEPGKLDKLTDLLVQLLGKGTKGSEGDQRGQENAAMAILSLAASPEAAEILIQKPKAIPAIANLFRAGSADGKEYAALVLQELLTAGKIEVFENGALVEGLVEDAVNVLKTGTADARKETAKLVQKLCVDQQTKQLLGQSGSMHQLREALMSVNQGGNSEAAKEASAALEAVQDV